MTVKIMFASVCAAGIAAISTSGALASTNALRSMRGAAIANDTSFSSPEWNPVDLHKVIAAAAEITPKKYPNCDSATVDQNSVRDYHADGTGECQDESFTKVLTEKGRRDNRLLTFPYMLPYSTASVAKVEVIRPDGTIVPVDIAANSKDTIDNSQMAENIYDPNSRVLSVNIPQLDIGDTVHVVSREIINRSIIPNEYDEGNVFEGSGYIRHISYVVHTPAARPLASIALRDSIPGTVQASKQRIGSEIVYRWEVNNVPRMFDEPDMPPYEMVLQRLFVSTVPRWQDVSQWYWNLSKPHLAMTTPEMKKTVQVLTAHAHTDQDKVTAIFYFVSKNIRYMGVTPEKDRPGFEPHDVCLTFNKKYGVCRDKAGLLVAMLRLAGFHAYPVLTNIGALLDPNVPQVGFDHAIACVELKEGQYTLMDPTDENTRDLLPAYDCNRSYLVCRPEGDMLRTSPVPSPDKHMLYVETTGTLNADGVLSAVSNMSFTGVNDDEYRNYLAHAKPDEQTNTFEEILKTAIPGVKLTSLRITPENILDTSQPLHAELRYTAVGLTANGGGKSVVSLPWISRHFAIVYALLSRDVGLQKRKYPLLLQTTCGVRENLSLKLAGGFAAPLSVPKLSTADRAMGYSQNVSYANGTLQCSREFKLKAVQFAPRQYQILKQALKDMDYDSRKSLIMALKTRDIKEALTAETDPADAAPESNARILDSEKSLEIVDAHTAVYHVKYSKQILTYDGKIREAEVKINYNPSCEDARIIHASVISKDGARQDISPDEINVMDQGWNTSARRYTGGKVLVASLPGVDIGSTISVEYEISMKGVPFVSGFEPFQFEDGLDSKTFDITSPNGVKVQTTVRGPQGIVKQQTQTGANQSFQWRAAKVDALSSEPSVPPDWDYEAGVGYFVGDAGDYWKTLNDAMLAHSTNSPNAAKLARQLIGSSTPASNPLAAIRAIRDFIAENIHLAGPSFTDLPLSELSDADTTLKDGYGHAADCAILYHAMLTAAGFHPEFVMASGLPAISGFTEFTRSFPLPNEFQTPLVKVTVDGEDYYLNDTDQYARLGTTDYHGKLGLALADQQITTIQAAKNCADKTENDYAIVLGKDGKARIEVSRRFYGQTYNDYKKYFAELPPEEREHYFQEAVTSVAQGARPVGGLITRFDTYPGLEQYTVDVDDYAVEDGKYLYFDLPFTGSLFGTLAHHRSLPIYFSSETDDILKAEIQLPSGYHATEIAPKNEKYALPGGSLASITQTASGGKCFVTEHFDTAPGVIDPRNYAALLNI